MDFIFLAGTATSLPQEGHDGTDDGEQEHERDDGDDYPVESVHSSRVMSQISSSTTTTMTTMRRMSIALSLDELVRYRLVPEQPAVQVEEVVEFGLCFFGAGVVLRAGASGPGVAGCAHGGHGQRDVDFEAGSALVLFSRHRGRAFVR
jgi:hypothetical protein